MELVTSAQELVQTSVLKDQRRQQVLLFEFFEDFFLLSISRKLCHITTSLLFHTEVDRRRPVAVRCVLCSLS